MFPPVRRSKQEKKHATLPDAFVYQTVIFSREDPVNESLLRFLVQAQENQKATGESATFFQFSFEFFRFLLALGIFLVGGVCLGK